MAKRVLTIAEQQQLRLTLQTATIAALMDSRRWAPGDIAFQGGTSLHLAHGSARFSEDLDFMVRGGLSLRALSAQIEKKLRLPADIPADLALAVSASKDDRNPHVFNVTLSGPNVLGSAKLKIELWQTPDAALKTLQLKISTITSAAGQAFVPTLTLSEIFADKVYAIGARARIKPRDIFDLAWLCEKQPFEPTAESLLTRLAIYPVESGNMADTASAWLANAEERLIELKSPTAAKKVMTDLKRWLPTSWRMDEVVAAEMLKPAVVHLSAAMTIMRNAMNMPQKTLAAAGTDAKAAPKAVKKNVRVKKMR